MSEHLQILVKAVPIKQGDKLRIIWPTTPGIRYYKEAPCRYLGHLIGHEGEGSLFHVLKRLGWATSLSAGEGDWTNEFSFFKVNIDLTDAGHATFETMFHYQDKIPAIDYVVGIASNMQLYPPKDWLVASSLPSKFSPSTIQMVLETLTPENVRIFWESKKFEGHTNMVEPWYGTAYSVMQLTDSLIQAELPVLLRKSLFSRLWYKPDTMFSIPKAYVRIDFNCPYTSHSLEAEVLTDIFARMLMDYLNEYGELVVVIGYNDKMNLLVDKIIEKIARFQVKSDRFSVIKETVIKEYENLKFQQPYQQAMYYCSLILNDHSWPWIEQLEILPHLEADDLSKFSPLLLSKFFLECYVAGNIRADEAESMIIRIEDIFFKGMQPISRSLLPSEFLTNRIVKLEKKRSHFYPVEVLNKSDENSAIVHYIQVHQDDFLLNVKLQLFALIAKQPAFHQLRSVEQLGYITVLMQRADCGIRGLQFIVQSAVKVYSMVIFYGIYSMPEALFLQDPGHIYLRVETFLKEFENKLNEMTNDEFRVSALKQLKQQELIDFFNEYIKAGAPQRKALTVEVYGGLHSTEYEAAKNETPPPEIVRIDDIFCFRNSQPLYASFKGGLGHMKL
ncbi:hypothetical protein Scep_003866 [Stephania cephalantha]|uniref:Insulin-degrading enzyme-like 1, peroxisomal n=1 Tax=Stephania cephalantha TaxID=152367 RepID=A0AAP0KT85_9MAGN